MPKSAKKYCYCAQSGVCSFLFFLSNDAEKCKSNVRKVGISLLVATKTIRKNRLAKRRKMMHVMEYRTLGRGEVEKKSRNGSRDASPHKEDDNYIFLTHIY